MKRYTLLLEIREIVVIFAIINKIKTMAELKTYRIILPSGKQIELLAVDYITYADHHRFYRVGDGLSSGFALIPLGSAIIKL